MDTRNLNPYDRESNIRNLMVMLTYKCQMSCRYCFIDRTRPDMSEAVLLRSIDLLLTSPCREVELQFLGGEPLLRFDLIKRAVTYAELKSREKSKKIRYFLITNGLLLDKKKLDYLRQYNINIMFSMDGCKDTQINNRPLTKDDNGRYFDLLTGNLKALIKRGGRYCVNLTFMPRDIRKLKDNVEFLIKLGVRDIRLSYAIGADFQRKDLSAYMGELKKIIKIVKAAGVNLLNLDDEEPCLSIPQITVGSSGDIYVGCTFILEKISAESVTLFYSGKLKNIRDISLLKRTRQEQLRILIEKRKKLHVDVMGNIYFSIGVYALLKYQYLCAKYALLAAGPGSVKNMTESRRKITRRPEVLKQKKLSPIADIIASAKDLESLRARAIVLSASGVKKIRFSPQRGVFWKEAEIADYFIMLFKIIEQLLEKKGIEIINMTERGDFRAVINSKPQLDAAVKAIKHCQVSVVSRKTMVNNLALREVSDSFFRKFC